jgi:hypothetical protein
MKHIHFKMEGVPTLIQLMKKDNYAVTWDLSSAYNHVPVHPAMQPLLGVCWKGECYKFVGMPFGLNDAPRVFSKIMKIAVNIIRDL